MYVDLKLQGPLEQHGDKKARHTRTLFTVYQRRELEKTFSQSHYVSCPKRQLLAQKLGISEERIQVHLQSLFPLTYKFRYINNLCFL